MLRSALIVLLAGALAGPALSQTVPATRAQIGLSFAPVVRLAAPAVVTIYTRKTVPARRLPFAGDPFFERFFGEMFPDLPARPRVRTSLGSGVIVDPGGIVVSNHHVVAGADAITVRLADRREFEGRVLLADETADLAVVALEGGTELPALALAASEGLEVGDLVLAIGNPFGVGQTVTSGIVSGLAREIPGRKGAGAFVQTDAAINPGNSGGALVDMAGRLVGVPTSILSRSGGSNGIGFAVPADLVARVIEAAKAGRTALPRPWLGIATQAVDGDLAAALGLDRPRGVAVTAIHPSSPFAAIGLGQGDVLLSLGGTEVFSPETLAYRAAALGPGRRAAVRWIGDGETRKGSVVLGPPPEVPARARLTLRRGALAGLTVETVNPAVIMERDLPVSARGVVVADVSGPARRSGLRPGDVILSANGRAVADSAGLGAALARGRRIRLEVSRGDRRGQVVVP